MSFLPRPNLGNVGKYTLATTKDTLSGFKSFILRGNVVDLAVGIVIGAAFTSVVNALVNHVITPLIPVPGNSLGGLHWPVPWAKKGVEVDISALFNAVLSFFIVAAVLYFFIVRPVNALMERYKPKLEEPAIQECPYCLQSIPAKALRCFYCTSMLQREVHLAEATNAETLQASDALSERLAERVARKALAQQEQIPETPEEDLPAGR